MAENGDPSCDPSSNIVHMPGSCAFSQSGGGGSGDGGGNKPRKASDLPKPGDNLTSDAGKAGRAHGMTKKEVEEAIHQIKGKAKVDTKLSGGRTNPDVFIEKQTGDVYWNYQGRVGPQIGNILNPPRGR